MPAKKLIEVALPLPEINDASAYDKMPGIGPHPKGIHHWWARLPLPTARAVLFASVVDDPSTHPEKFRTEAAQNAERERLFDIIRRLMQKKLHEHPEVYAEAGRELEKYCDGKMPLILDPFAGGGSIPLEAHRLGFPVRASDLNPVAVLINQALLKIVPAWADSIPVHPSVRKSQLLREPWKGARGLAEDVRRYSDWMLDRARTSLARYYPAARAHQPVVAWLWCRTVASPDPARRGAHVPLLRSLRIAKKKTGAVWLKPVVKSSQNEWHFSLSNEKPPIAATVGRRGGTCILSGTSIPLDYIRAEGRAGRLGLRLMAVVSEGREYHEPGGAPPVPELPKLDGVAAELMPHNPFAVRPPLYGLLRFSDVFTPRQLHALGVLSDLVREAREQVFRDATKDLGKDAAARYADAIATFLGFAVDRCVDFNNALCRWSSSNQKVMSTFGRPAIPMIWDFAEANILGESIGSWKSCSDYVSACIEVALVVGQKNTSMAIQADAADSAGNSDSFVVSTDPPYYNNVDYSDLSDFFYVWLRRSLSPIYPELFGTVLTPKAEELVASPYRFDGDKEKARDHFESGFRNVFGRLRRRLDERFPMTVYYAFKQDDEESAPADEAEDEGNGVDLTTGWETLLEALVSSGFQITATWPVRASQQWRQMSMGMNALASYIVLACRPRAKDAPQTGRREFMAELRRELPTALRHLQQGSVAPVDFAQAAIGPGMAVFSRFSRVLESSGQSMTVRTALAVINQILGEVLTEQEDEFDADTRWALAWFEQKGFAEGEFGEAEILSKAKNTSVNGLVDAGILRSARGKVRLLRPEELDKDWDPVSDDRLTVWGMTHHLLRVFYVEKQGEAATAALLRKLGSRAEVARDLGYRLFRVAEKLHSQDAQAYNALVLAWTDLVKLAQAQPGAGPVQGEMI